MDRLDPLLDHGNYKTDPIVLVDSDDETECGDEEHSTVSGLLNKTQDEDDDDDETDDDGEGAIIQNREAVQYDGNITAVSKTTGNVCAVLPRAPTTIRFSSK